MSGCHGIALQLCRGQPRAGRPTAPQLLVDEVAAQLALLGASSGELEPPPEPEAYDWWAEL